METDPQARQPQHETTQGSQVIDSLRLAVHGIANRISDIRIQRAEQNANSESLSPEFIADLRETSTRAVELGSNIPDVPEVKDATAAQAATYVKTFEGKSLTDRRKDHFNRSRADQAILETQKAELEYQQAESNFHLAPNDEAKQFFGRKMAAANQRRDEALNAKGEYESKLPVNSPVQTVGYDHRNPDHAQHFDDEPTPTVTYEPLSRGESRAQLKLAQQVSELESGRKTQSGDRSALGRTGRPSHRPKRYNKYKDNKLRKRLAREDNKAFKNGEITAEELADRRRTGYREHQHTTVARVTRNGSTELVPTPRPILRRAKKLDKLSKSIVGDAEKAIKKARKIERKPVKLAEKAAYRTEKQLTIVERMQARKEAGVQALVHENWELHRSRPAGGDLDPKDEARMRKNSEKIAKSRERIAELEQKAQHIRS